MKKSNNSPKPHHSIYDREFTAGDLDQKPQQPSMQQQHGNPMFAHDLEFRRSNGIQSNGIQKAPNPFQIKPKRN